MSNRVGLGGGLLRRAGILGLCAAFVSVGGAMAGEKQAFHAKGVYVEGCSCGIPCACELAGLEAGCQGVGAMEFTAGKFNGVSLAGVKLAYAGVPGKWYRVYADAPKAEQKEAALALGKAWYREWGTCEEARAATISIGGKDGEFTVAVDGGKTMELRTEPVVGGDGKTPVKISNIKNKLSPAFLQGRTLTGSFHGGDRTFELKDSNAYFTPVNKSGEI